MGDIDLQRLADTPGAGKADKMLTENGHRREPRPELAREYEVDVHYTVAVRRTVTVMAEGGFDALDRAREIVERDHGQIAGRVDCVVIDTCSTDREDT